MKNLFREIIALFITLCMIVGMTVLPRAANADGSDDADIVAADKAALAIGFSVTDSVYGATADLTLPLTGVSGSTITWQSDTPEVIAHDGAVTRPDADAEDAEVTLTAIITYGKAEDSKEFTVTVLKEDELQMLMDPMSTVEWVGDGLSGVTAFQVSSAEHLAAIPTTSLTAHYVQTANIDLAGYTNWTPIGNNTTQFTGTYDGDGYTISNLYINSADSWAGLFGYIGSGGMLKNITLEDVSASFNASGGGMGALVGYNSGNIEKCCSSGSLQTGQMQNISIGGLVGGNNGTIRESLSSCTVTGGRDSGAGTGPYIGGLVGSNNGTISDNSASGTISVGKNAYGGGLVGRNHSVISNSTSSGNVTGGEGSFVGGLSGSDAPTSRTDDCHSTGNVSGILFAQVGGLIGYRLADATSGVNVTNSSSTGYISATGNTGGLIGGSGSSYSRIAFLSIDITAPAQKTIYNIGESLDITGLVVKGFYDGNNNAVLPIKTTNITGFNSSTVAGGSSADRHL